MAPPPLFAHQVESIRLMLGNERILDTSDPGTGKTRVQIETFAARRQRGGKCALVLAPKSLLRCAWEADFRKFASHLDVAVATAERREEAFEADADVYVTNIDAVRWLAKQKPKFFERFDTLIIDESSHFKHHTSQRSRGLNKIKKHFRYRYALTGTPNSNSIADLWNQVFILDDGKRLGTSFYQFRASVCEPKQVGPSPNMVQWRDRQGAELAVGTLLDGFVIRHKLEECISIPENHLYSLEHQLPPKQMKVYRTMEKNALTILSNGDEVSTVNAAGVATKLLQIASGAVYNDDGGYSVVDTKRYELVAELVQARKHSVVFFNWTHQRDQLIAAFDAEGITYAVIDGSTSAKDRKTYVDHFQAGFYRVLLAHPASAAHGLTLTKGTATIWASPTYNLEHFVQGNRRIYRAGQTERTETIIVIAPNTIEEHVYEMLKNKDERQMTLLDVLKEMSN